MGNQTSNPNVPTSTIVAIVFSVLGGVALVCAAFVLIRMMRVGEDDSQSRAAWAEKYEARKARQAAIVEQQQQQPQQHHVVYVQQQPQPQPVQFINAVAADEADPMMGRNNVSSAQTVTTVVTTTYR